MDSKKLAKLIKVIVEAEVAKKQEQFLSKTFPKILEEEVNRRVKLALNELKGGVSHSTQVVEQEIDPFERAEALLQQERAQQPQKPLSRNAAINEVLAQTKPFTAEQRSGKVGGSSVLDKFQPQPQQIQESYIPNYMDAEPDIDQTVSFTANSAPMGTQAMRSQMAAKMGYGDMNMGNGARQGGLGVTTGLSGLDRILNRDNSALVKAMMKK